MHQAAFGIDADGRLHPEVPVPVLLRRTHLRISLAVPVLGAARRRQDRRVHDRAGLHQQALRGQPCVDLAKNVFRQIVTLQQAAEVEHRGLVRHSLIERIKPEETLKR